MVLRAKRVSDPLNDRVKTRLLSSSVSSSGFIDESDIGFQDLEPEPKSKPVMGEDYNSDEDDYDHDHVTRCMHALKTAHDNSRDPDRPFLLRLRSDVTAAVTSGLGSLVARLRRAGYNAGLCRAKWGPKSGLTSSGSYDYVDVEHGGRRYIVDVEFRAQFAVARATEGYERVVGMVPEVAVGREEEVEEVVAAVEEAARRELKGRGLSVPPWRKRRYVLDKWFGPYRRVIKAVDGGGGGGGGEVRCRKVGFHIGGIV